MLNDISSTELYTLKSGQKVYADTDDVNKGHAKGKTVVLMLIYV